MSIISTIKKTISGGEQKQKRRSAAAKAVPSEKQKEHVPETAHAPAFHASFAGALITHPYLTEKSSLLQANHNAYVFKVHRSATANEVKKAVQKLFSVSVTKVNMANMPSKTIRLGVREGHIPGFRKAIVTLKKGDMIDIGT